jgi:hypothetical protein
MPDEQQSIRIIIFLHGSVDRWSEAGSGTGLFTVPTAARIAYHAESASPKRGTRGLVAIGKGPRFAIAGDTEFCELCAPVRSSRRPHGCRTFLREELEA